MCTLAKRIPDIVAIIAAAGIGNRMQANLPKQYLTIGNKTLIEYSIDALLYHPCICKVIVTISAEDYWFQKLPVSTDSRIHIVTGGSIRANSVMTALRYASKASWVLVHDAVRPYLHQDDLNRLLAITAYSKIGGVLATPVRDTVKRSYTDSNIIATTIKRENLWNALTPQLFVYDLLITCLERALSEGATITDEASAMEYCGYAPLLVPGRSDNIKVTYPEDLALVRSFFSQFSNNTEEI